MSGIGPKPVTKCLSSAAPVGVQSSPRTSPPYIGTPSRMRAVAGAGTGRTPWAQRTVPLPTCTGEAVTRAGASSCMSSETAATSATGGMTHNLTQILVAAAIIGDSVFLYLPYMLVIGFFAGLFTGVCCHFCLATADRLNKKKMTDFGGEVGKDCDMIENTEDKSDAGGSKTDDGNDSRSEDKH